MDTKKIWTKDEIRKNLETSQAWVERGILAIYRQQTADEQSQEDTRWFNQHGFSSADAKYLTYTAKWLLSGKHLSGLHIGKARARLLKYAGQLAKIANGTLVDNEKPAPRPVAKKNHVIAEGEWK